MLDTLATIYPLFLVAAVGTLGGIVAIVIFQIRRRRRQHHGRKRVKVWTPY
jgi:hypothetical protein